MPLFSSPESYNTIVCPWGAHITLYSDRGVGGYLYFTTKKRPCLHYHNLQDIAHTNTPGQYRLNSI